MANDSPKTEKKLSKVEGFKEASNYLRGDIPEELVNGTDQFGSGSMQLLKHHGTYQQDDRDVRMANRAAGNKDKAMMMMLRTRVTGGVITPQQMLAELQICDDLGDNTMRLTTRQAIQHHGILKSDLKETIQRIHAAKMSTLGACGDVNRNVMCCPAPYNDNIHAQMQQLAEDVTERLLPHSTAYYDIWLKDMESGDKELVSSAGPSGINNGGINNGGINNGDASNGSANVDSVEPVYGKTYLPRKFKTGIALPEDNCIDIYTQDLGYLAVVENGKIIGYNVLVGGGMGTTPAQKKTFPAVARRMCFVTPEQAVDVGEAVVKVQRDNGNRADRKVARLKYLVTEWGIEKFRAKVEEYYGQKLADCHPTDVHGYPDHMGWEEQGDGKWFYGLNIENGRIKDTDEVQLKSAIREICQTMELGLRVTAHQSLLFTDLDVAGKEQLESILAKYNVITSDKFSETRRWAMACVAWPTCGLAITESERALPDMITELEGEMKKLGLQDEKYTIRMTGCPNGCARPYNADIGLVGKSKDAYTVFLGGGFLGNRLNQVYLDRCPRDEVVPQLAKVFGLFKAQRVEGETFGTFCDRVGNESLLEQTGNAVSS